MRLFFRSGALGPYTALLLAVTVLFYSLNAQAAMMVIEDFSVVKPGTQLPSGWRILEFPKITEHTRYSIVSEGGESFLKAESEASASAIYKEVRVKLREYPVLNWRWKVDGVLVKGDARTKMGDDYPARVYVTFAYDPENTPLLERVKYKIIETIYGKTPANAINYIWANRLEKGKHLPNSYTAKAMMVAVESGSKLAGRWVSESRNVYKDYIELFGEEPPEVVSIALMTDTDNTGEKATSYFDDIYFSKV